MPPFRCILKWFGWPGVTCRCLNKPRSVLRDLPLVRFLVADNPSHLYAGLQYVGFLLAIYHERRRCVHGKWQSFYTVSRRRPEVRTARQSNRLVRVSPLSAPYFPTVFMPIRGSDTTPFTTKPSGMIRGSIFPLYLPCPQPESLRPAAEPGVLMHFLSIHYPRWRKAKRSLEVLYSRCVMKHGCAAGV